MTTPRPAQFVILVREHDRVPEFAAPRRRRSILLNSLDEIEPNFIMSKEAALDFAARFKQWAASATVEVLCIDQLDPRDLSRRYDEGLKDLRGCSSRSVHAKPGYGRQLASRRAAEQLFNRKAKVIGETRKRRSIAPSSVPIDMQTAMKVLEEIEIRSDSKNAYVTALSIRSIDRKTLQVHMKYLMDQGLIRITSYPEGVSFHQYEVTSAGRDLMWNTWEAENRFT